MAVIAENIATSTNRGAITRMRLKHASMIRRRR